MHVHSTFHRVSAKGKVRSILPERDFPERRTRRSDRGLWHFFKIPGGALGRALAALVLARFPRRS